MKALGAAASLPMFPIACLWKSLSCHKDSQMLLRIVLQELFQKAPTWQTRILHWSLTEIPVHIKQKRLERKYFLFSEHLPNKHKIHLGLTIILYPPFVGGGSCCDWNDCIVICLKKLFILVTSPKQIEQCFQHGIDDMFPIF